MRILIDIDEETLQDIHDSRYVPSCIKDIFKSATPEPKIGHWVITDDCEQFIAKCSKCGRIEDSRMINKYPYCRCGAKMQEVEKMTIDEIIEILVKYKEESKEDYYVKRAKALDVAIKSLKAWEKVKAEITEVRDIEAKNHDTFDDYSNGRYDVACKSLRIINKHLQEVGE